MVRFEFFGGEVFYYEGEKNAERKVRCVLPEGDVFYFEGEKGAERKVRCVRPWGDVFDYEGEQGAEQMVRLGLPFGFSMQPWSTVTTVDNSISSSLRRTLAAIVYRHPGPLLAVFDLPQTHSLALSQANAEW